MRTRISLTLEDADLIAEGCIAFARQDGKTICVAVTDDAGVTLALRRMDGARTFSVDLATRKARASALVGAPTSVIEAMQRERPGSPEMTVGQGGLPVVHNGQCAGAVGVSGAKPDEDERIAKAGIDRLRQRLAVENPG